MTALTAIMQANRDRLRPDPDDDAHAGRRHAAAGAGHRSRRRRTPRVAVVVIGGQTLSLLLTLLVTPVAYSLFDDLATSHALSRLAFWRRAATVTEN